MKQTTYRFVFVCSRTICAVLRCLARNRGVFKVGGCLHRPMTALFVIRLQSRVCAADGQLYYKFSCNGNGPLSASQGPSRGKATMTTMMTAGSATPTFIPSPAAHRLVKAATPIHPIQPSLTERVVDSWPRSEEIPLTQKLSQTSIGGYVSRAGALRGSGRCRDR